MCRQKEYEGELGHNLHIHTLLGSAQFRPHFITSIKTMDRIGFIYFVIPLSVFDNLHKYGFECLN